ncbi:MAG: NAAT family transporter [Deltaproteobacteria bacterium]|nr:NAAT family transporter [Deltaproteobacteria bacterium]
MMLEQWTEHIKIVTGLVAIVNPIGAVPLFVTLSQQMSVSDRKKTVKIASLTVCCTLLLVMFCGQAFLNYFGISVASFKVGGGILLLLMAISMLHGNQLLPKHTEEEAQEAVTKESIAVVPLAIPMLAGPGAISSVILYSNQSNAFHDELTLVGAILIVSLLTLIILNMGHKIAKALRKTGVNIVSRVMGLIIAAIGVEFICDGLVVLIPGLAR